MYLNLQCKTEPAQKSPYAKTLFQGLGRRHMLRSAHAQNQEGRTSNPAPPNTYHKGICLNLRLPKVKKVIPPPSLSRLFWGICLNLHTPKIKIKKVVPHPFPTLVSLASGHMLKFAHAQIQEGCTHTAFLAPGSLVLSRLTWGHILKSAYP